MSHGETMTCNSNLQFTPSGWPKILCLHGTFNKAISLWTVLCEHIFCEKITENIYMGSLDIGIPMYTVNEYNKQIKCPNLKTFYLFDEHDKYHIDLWARQ